MAGLFGQTQTKSQKSGGIFARNAERNEEARQRRSDPSLNTNALQNEKVMMMKQDSERAPALSMPKVKPAAKADPKFTLPVETSQQAEKRRRQEQRDAQDPDNPILKAIKDNTIDAFAGQVDRFLLDSKPGQFISRFGQAGAQMAGVQPTYEATTGSKAADVTANVLGTIGGVFVNPTGPTSSVAGQGSIVGQAYNNPTVQRLAAITASRVRNPLGQRVASEAVREGITGAVEGGATTLLQGNSDPRDIATNAAIGGVGGGLIGGALPVAGKALSAAGESIMNSIRSRQPVKTVTKTVEEVLPPTSARLERKPGLSRVLEEIKPVVDSRLTPPYENQNELAKWIKNNIGMDNISLNEIRKLPYEDMRQIAEELRKQVNVYDTAVNVSRERGYNLERLLDNKRTLQPGMVQKAKELQRMRNVAGVGMPVKSTAERTVTKTVEVPDETYKQHWFTRLFGQQGVGIVPSFDLGKRNKHTTEGQIVNNPIRNTVKGGWENVKAAARSTYQNFVDMNDPIKKISKEAYDASMDAQRANQLANVIVSDKFVTPEGQVVGEGLQNIVRKIGRGNYNAFTDYLVLRHAKTRMARGERVYDEKLQMTPEKVQERLNVLESRYPHFKSIGAQWDNFYRNMRNVYGVDGDLLPKSLAEHLEKANPNYASMRRQFTNLEKIKGLNNFGQKQMFSGQKAPIHEVSPTGSTRKIVDPVRTAIEQTGAWVNAVMRNRVMKEIVNKISADPESMKHIAEIVQPPKGKPNLREILEKEGEEGYLEMLQEDFNKLFKKSPLDKDNIVRAMIKGEPVYVKVNDVEAVKALLGMGAEQANIALAIMNALSNTIKQGATGALAPLFAVKGATMDVAQAIIQAENPLAHAGYLLGSIFSAIGDSLKIPGLRKWAQDFYRAGGGYSAALRGERGLRKGISRMRLDPVFHPRTIAKGVGRAIAAPYKLSIKLADIAENMNRIAAYNYKLRQLGGQPTPENVREAMNYAREITTNYSRKGRKSQMLEAIIPYNNAAIQGMYRFAKAWKQNPIKTSAMVGLAVLAPKAFEYARFHDDEDYQNLPARERYRNIIYSKNPDGTFNKAPMAPEYNALGALMVDLLRAYRDGDPEAFKGVSDALANSFTPPAATGALQGLTQGGGIEQSGWGIVNATSVGPIMGALGNKTFYGAPVESMKVSDRSPGMRYDERTSSAAKWLGEKMNLSPMKIDYVLRAYGGDPARLLLPLTSDVGAGRTRETLLKNFIVDPVFTNNITNDFYQGKELLSQAYRDNQEVGRPLPKWFSEDLRKLVTSTAKGSVSKKVSELNEQKRTIQLDKSLTPEQKAQKLRDIQAQINDLFIDVNTKMREAGVPILNR